MTQPPEKFNVQRKLQREFILVYSRLHVEILLENTHTLAAIQYKSLPTPSAATISTYVHRSRDVHTDRAVIYFVVLHYKCMAII